MDSFTLNKIAGAVLGTCMAGLGLGIIGEMIYSPEGPKKPGYALPEPKAETKTGPAPEGPPEASLPALLAKADAKKGEANAKVCSACHNFEEGAGAKVGPDLYAVVERPKASAPGFDYSSALKAKGGKWTYEDLNAFITKPSAYVSGTKMGYPGEANPEKRADILAYLRTLSKNPVPLPPVTEAAAKAGDANKPADGAKPAAGAATADAGGGFIKLVAAADPKKGQADVQVCGACHNLKKGAGALVGPDLYGVVDRPKGSVEGFDYSAGMKAKGGQWTYDDLNAFLTKPSAFVQGTKMGYPGEPNEKKRAEIVAYLRTLADSPAPLPGADAGKPEAAADAPKPDAPKPDAPKPDAPKPDAPKPDAPKPDAPKPDAPPAPAPPPPPSPAPAPPPSDAPPAPPPAADPGK